MLDPEIAMRSSNVELIDRLLSLSNRCAIGDARP